MNLLAPSCTTNFFRIGPSCTALILAWITLTASMNAYAMDDPCFGITYQGKCEGNVVTWCESNELIQVDCSDHNAICQWQEEEDYWGCTPMEEVDTCQHGEQGECIDDTTVAWCSGLDQTTLTCDEGTLCGWNAEKLYFDCIPEEDLEDGRTEELSSEDPRTNEPNTANEPDEEGLDNAEQVVRVMEGTATAERSETEPSQQSSQPSSPFSISDPLESDRDANGCQQQPSFAGTWLLLLVLIGTLRFSRPTVA